MGLNFIPAGRRKLAMRAFFVQRLLPGCLAGIFFVPLLPIVLSFFSAQTANWDHIIKYVLKKEILTTIGLMVFTGLFSFMISFSLAWLLCLYDFPGRKIFEYLMILPLTIPAYIGAYAYHKIFDFSGPVNSFFRNQFGIRWLLEFDLFSFWGGVFIFTTFFFPYLYLSLLSFFRKYAGEMVEAARTLGTGASKIALRLLLPLAHFPIIAGLTMICMEVLNDFGVTVYLGLQTFSRGIFKAWFGMNDLASAAKLASFLIPATFILLYISKLSQKNGPLRGYIPSRIVSLRRLTSWRAGLAIAYCLVILSIGYIIPVALMIRYTWIILQISIPWDVFSVLLGSIVLVVLSTMLLMMIATYLASASRNHGQVYSEIFSLQYALPGIVVAVAVTLSFSKAEEWGILPVGTLIFLRESYLLLIFSYVMRFLLLGYNSAHGAFKKMGNTYKEVAKTLGRGSVYIFWRVELPIVLPTLVFGSLMVMIDIFKELPLTLFLRPFNFDTPATQTYDLMNDEMFAEATPSALLLIFLLGMIILLTLRWTHQREQKEGHNGTTN